MWLGVALCIIGILELLNTFGVVHVDIWGTAWPVLIIALGASIAAKSLRKRP